MKLSKSSLKIQNQSRSKYIDAIDGAINIGKELTEESALVLLMKIHSKETIYPEYNKWLNLDDYLPPQTDESIVVTSDLTSNIEKSVITQKAVMTLYNSHVFLKFYLLSKYYYKQPRYIPISNCTHFMLLSMPQE